MKKRRIILLGITFGLSVLMSSGGRGDVETRDFYTITDHPEKPMELVALVLEKDTIITL